MLYRREGLPAEDELVLCTVTKILGHAIFVNLDEYDKGGLVHISEVAPGRIRNIREFVELSKKIVCKVLRVDSEKGHIDLSLRRVSEIERKNKLETIKQEQKAEKVIEIVAQQLKNNAADIYEMIASKVFEKYSFVHLFFKEVAVGTAQVSEFVPDVKIAQLLEKEVQERFKPQRVVIKGVFTLKSYASDGVDVVKSALLEAQKKVGKNSGVVITYVGGGKYKAKIDAENYKGAEQTLVYMEEYIGKHLAAHHGESAFAREDK